MELIDGMNRPVAFTATAIKRAVLGATSIVTLKEMDELSISFSEEGSEGDEVDVFDPFSGPSGSQEVYEPEQIDQAVAYFMRLCQRGLR